MFPFLQNLFGSAAGGAPGAVANALPMFGFDPNARASFDPAQGRVIGIPGAQPPMPTPKPEVAPAPPPQAPLPQMREPMNPPPMPPQQQAAPPGMREPVNPPSGNPLLDFIHAKYRTGGTF